MTHFEERSEYIAIKFLEWTEKGMWSKYESRSDGVHEMEGWYNTANYKSMPKPLSTQELYKLFTIECQNERDKKNDETLIYWAKQLEHKSLSLHEIVENAKWLLKNTSNKIQPNEN